MIAFLKLCLAINYTELHGEYTEFTEFFAKGINVTILMNSLKKMKDTL